MARQSCGKSTRNHGNVVDSSMRVLIQTLQSRANPGKEHNMATNGTDIASWAAGAEHSHHAGGADMMQGENESALVPLLNKVAESIAKGLLVAMKELEDHIALETRNVGDAVDRRLDTLQNSLHEISRFVADQHSTNTAVEGRLQELQGSLHETSSRYTV